MSASAIINEAVAEHFELHADRLERLAAKVHAYHDLDAMAAATTNKALRSVFENMGVNLKESIEDATDFCTREVLFDLRHGRALSGERKPESDPFFWNAVQASVVDAVNERAAGME